MTTRENLLASVSRMVQGYFGVTTALEHDAGDYEYADAMSGETGKPITVGTFQGDESHNEPYAGQSASRLYFHIDEANNRAVIVDPPSFLCGGGYVINGHDGTCEPRWRS